MLEELSSKPLIIALDTGKACTGWAVMEGDSLIGYGLWSFSEAKTYPEMGAMLYASIANLVDEVTRLYRKPDYYAWEHAFRQAGMAGEVYKFLSVMGCMYAYDHEIAQLPVASSSMKKTVTGDGRAEKVDVVRNINAMYGLELSLNVKDDKDHNAADAIGAALVCYHKISKPKVALGMAPEIKKKRRKAKRYKKRVLALAKQRDAAREAAQGYGE